MPFPNGNGTVLPSPPSPVSRLCPLALLIPHSTGGRTTNGSWESSTISVLRWRWNGCELSHLVQWLFCLCFPVTPLQLPALGLLVSEVLPVCGDCIWYPIGRIYPRTLRLSIRHPLTVSVTRKRLSLITHFALHHPCRDHIIVNCPSPSYSATGWKSVQQGPSLDYEFVLFHMLEFKRLHMRYRSRLRSVMYLKSSNAARQSSRSQNQNFQHWKFLLLTAVPFSCSP